MKIMSIFIAFEGIDGSGKTTQINFISKWLKEKNYPIFITREPGGTKLGESLRNLVLHSENMSSKTEMLLFSAARSHHVNKVIKPLLKSGTIVLCDRYIDSSLAYQGYGRNLEIEKIIDISLWAVDNLMPNICIVLDLDIKYFMKRISVRASNDRIEKSGINFMNNVRNGYLKLAKEFSKNHFIIDASLPEKEISAKIINIIKQYLMKRKICE